MTHSKFGVSSTSRGRSRSGGIGSNAAEGRWEGILGATKGIGEVDCGSKFLKMPRGAGWRSVKVGVRGDLVGTHHRSNFSSSSTSARDFLRARDEQFKLLESLAQDS